MADSSTDSCSDESFVLLDIWDISRSRMGDKELAALKRVCSEEVFLGQTNVTTFGLTKFIEELLSGYRTLLLCTLLISSASCNLYCLKRNGFCGELFGCLSNSYSLSMNEELLSGYRTLPLCTLFVSPARCNLTAIALSLKAKFNPKSNEYEIHSKVASVCLLITRGAPKDFEPIELRIRTV